MKIFEGIICPFKYTKLRNLLFQSHSNTSTPVKSELNGLSVKKDLHGKNVRLSPKTSNIMAPAVNSLVSALNNTNNNDESDSDVLKIDEDGDNNTNVTKDASEDDIAEVENENGLDDSEEEIAMGNKEIAERTGKILPSKNVYLFIY